MRNRIVRIVPMYWIVTLGLFTLSSILSNTIMIVDSTPGHLAGSMVSAAGSRTHGPRIHTTSAFAAAFRRPWSGPPLDLGSKPTGAAPPVGIG